MHTPGERRCVPICHVLLFPRLILWQVCSRGVEGRAAAEGERGGAGELSGVRGAPVLANPYVVGYEREREAAARAYRRLLRATIAGEGGDHGQDRVELVGRLAGFGGEVRGWEWGLAREKLWLLQACRPHRGGTRASR